MKPIVKGMMAAVFTLTLVMAVPVEAQASRQTTTFPITDAQFNTCNGDLVVINGENTITTNIKSNGQVLVGQLSERIRGTGLSATGAEYTFYKTSKDQFSTNESVFRSHQISLLRLTKVGGSKRDDLFVMANTTYLINMQTGTVVRESQQFQAKCR